MSDLFYTTYGDGDKRVLLVHGWASSHTMWNNIHPHIQNATAYALDLAGFGHSSAVDSALTVDAHVESVIKFAEEIAKPQMIIAHSMGGLITLKALQIRPDLAEQVVLICPVVTGRFGALGGIASDIIRNEMAVNALRATKDLWTMVQNEYWLNATVPLVHSNPQLAERVKQNFLMTRPQAGIEAIISMAKQNTVEHLPTITQPTLVMVSTGDTTVPHTEGRTAAECIPNSELVVFDKSRHHPMDEETDKFVPILREFIGRYGY
ncbi:MAG: alpha/beta hydrolase [Chloroflexota bacterium]